MSSPVPRGSAGFYLSQSRRVWNRLPGFVRRGRAGRVYGRHLHRLVCRRAERRQNHSTFFLRNRPELELMRRLLHQKAPRSSLKLCVIACSKGAEVYSILWALRSLRRDLRVDTQAMDISPEFVEFAKRGIYSRRGLSGLMDAKQDPDTQLAETTWRDQGLSIFHRMTEDEMASMFEMDEDQARIRPWLKEGITWLTGDAGDPELIRTLGPQDMVVANRFLCHMDSASAEQCLRNIAQLVKPGGHLFVSGIDLDVRAKVAKDLGWKPVLELMKEIHEGDITLNQAWPLEWWGLEPFCTDLPDWKFRFASAFQIR